MGTFVAIRIEVATGRREEIARTDFKLLGVIGSGAWSGWTEDWEPLTVRDLSSTQVYHLRQFADLAPEEYRCLNRIKSGIACPRLHSLPRNLRPQRTPHDRGRA